VTESTDRGMDWDYFTGYYGLFNDVSALTEAIRDLGGKTGPIKSASTLDFIDNPLVAQSIMRELDIGDGLEVLDVGCGLGGPARLYAQAGARVTGVDLLPEQLAACAALNELLGTEFELMQGDAESLPIPDERFDAYVSIGALCHTYDRGAALREAHRVLRRGGRLSVADITAGPEPGPEYFGRRFWHLVSCEEYGRLTRAAGFTEVLVEDLREDYARQIDIYVEVMRREPAIFRRRFGGEARFRAALETYDGLLAGLIGGSIGACWVRGRRSTDDQEDR
jgi:ubiquinone/menaquinone biosynthesis C-methylase UbiE